MAYTKTTWIDDVTPISATNMNKIEQGIFSVDNLEVPIGTIAWPSWYTIPGWTFSAFKDNVYAGAKIGYIPIFVSRSITFSEVSAYVTTASYQSTLSIALYKSEDLMPTERILDFGVMDCATTGQKDIVVEFTLEKGFYFIGALAFNSPKLRGIDTAMGYTSPASGCVSSGQTYADGIGYASTATQLTDPAGIPTSLNIAERCGVVKFKIK